MEEFIQLNEAYEILTNPKFKVKPKIKPKPKETKKEAHKRWAKKEREQIRKRAEAKAKQKPKVLLRKTAKELFIKDATKVGLFLFPIPVFFWWVISSSVKQDVSTTDLSIINNIINTIFIVFIISYLLFLLVIARFYFKRIKK